MRRRASRGVSDVIATILLLGLTVTLFASIFFFVNTFPVPPPQPENQFTAGLTYGGSGALTIETVSITHLAGPSIPNNDQVYITSAAHPSRNPPPFLVSAGLSGSGAWNLGQVWTKNISTYALTAPDNLTVSVVSASQLIFRISLPGSNPNTPPDFIAVGTTPAAPAVGVAIVVYAQIADSNLKSNSVYVNYSELPGSGGASKHVMTFSGATGLWTFTIPSGTTNAAGTYYLFINASDNNGLKNSVAFAVTLTAPNAPITVSLTATPATIVAGSAVTLTAQVVNLGSGAGLATVSFTANAAAVGSSSQSIAAGGVASFTQAWTPSVVGVYQLFAVASIAGGSSASAALNVTVFPAILLLAHNVASGTNQPDNSSGWLASELTADGIPYSAQFVSCKTALTSGLFSSYKVAIVDFGSAFGSCPKSASTTDQSAITGASTTSFWVVGSIAFGAAACNANFNSAFFSLLGAKYTAGQTCMTLPNATGTATYAASLASGVRADGVPASIVINKTIAGTSNEVPYDYFKIGATNTAYLTVGGNPVGTWASGAVKGAALASEPALLAAALPTSNNWGTGAAGAAVTYNIVDWLSGLTNATSNGRALADYGVAETLVVGVNHAQLTNVYAAIRANGPIGGPVTVTLYVNGTPALFGGAPVETQATVTGGGGVVFVSLTWQAPSSGRYTLSIVITAAGNDYDIANDQLGMSILNQATNFA
ncbi:MAG: type IV pilin [Thermoplasmata archaeon]|nr:type IV pilin [Thermoplasmata archaeon]